MGFRNLFSRRTLAPVAFVVAIVLLAISPRALLAPALSFNRAQESKRPKTPKNIVRADCSHTSNAERSNRLAKADHPEVSPEESHDLKVRIALASTVPGAAFRELTKPAYLKLFSGSPPQAGLAPPL
jgi:hypothetical protein